MTATTLTIVSGIVLLAVFVLVGWNLRRTRGPDEGPATSSSDEEKSK